MQMVVVRLVAFVCVPLAALILGACESSGTVAPPTPVAVSGAWIGDQTVTSLTGGECLAASLQTLVNQQTPVRATLTQSGTAVTATLDNGQNSAVCNYTGTIGSNVLVLSVTACVPAKTTDVRCPGGGVRDVEVQSESLRLTVAGNRMTGTAVETDAVLVSGTTTSVGTVVIDSSLTLARQ
jgi:hypothetical protein